MRIIPEDIPNPDLEPELRKCTDDIGNINDSVATLVRGLTDAQLLWQPGPGQWSISQCLDHLVATNRADLPRIRLAITTGRCQKLFGHGPFRYGPFGWVLIKVMGAPPRLKFKVPNVYLPSGNSPPREVIGQFFLAQEEMLDCIREANGLHLARTKMTIPGHKYLRLSLGQEFRLIVVHQQRHVWQTRQIKSRPYFPGA